MRIRTFICLVFLSILFFLPPAYAKHKHDPVDETTPSLGGEIKVMPNTVVLETQGIVCSFCAYGAKKKLTKLGFIDLSGGKDEAVLTDIRSGRMTVKVLPDQPIELKNIAKAVKKAGYKLVGVHLHLSGTLSAEGDQTFLINDSNGQRFQIGGDILENVKGGEKIEIQAHLDQAQIAALKKDGKYQLRVDRLGSL